MEPYLNPALLSCSSLEVTFPDTLGDTMPQAPALPFTLFSDRGNSNFLLGSRNVVKRCTS